MTEFKSAIVQQNRLLPGIHGLRGIAAISVVLFHLKHLTGISPPHFFGFIGRDFGFSVHLFFILSAFSLMHSTEPHTSRPSWVSEYFIKRFFRIAPLFYVMIPIEAARQVIMYGELSYDLDIILLNISFTFGFVPHTSFVRAGWTVGIEMIFYAIFPVLLMTIKTHGSALLMLFLSILICYFIRLELHEQSLAPGHHREWNWSYLAFQSNACFFVMGIYAYFLSHRINGKTLPTITTAVVSMTMIAGLMFFDAGSYFRGSGRWDIVVWGLGLMALCVWQSVSPSLLIANKVCEYLGERSFSIYLLHPVVIIFSRSYQGKIYDNLLPHIGLYAFFVCAILTTISILIIAEFTYRLVEVPGIKYGKKLIQQRKPA